MPVLDRPRDGDRTPSRVAYLDGIRGLAALYVALHHAALMVPSSGLSGPGLVVRFLLRHGHSAVAVFIVLSGYCLMLPRVREPAPHRSLDLGRYFVRRGRRILPGYLAALLGSLALIAWLPELGRVSRSPWDRALPATGAGVVVSHLLLIHNLHETWFYKIDPPLWSVATEWQIYWLFPGLVVIWRRFGRAAVVASGFALGFGVAVLASPLRNPALRELCPWFIGLFTLGMVAALTAHRDRGVSERVPRSRRSQVAATVLLVLFALLLAGFAISSTDDPRFMMADPFVGVVTAGLLVRWARRSAPGETRPRPPLLRWLEWPWVLRLGTFSYSLYLIHYPLLALGNAWLRRWPLGQEVRFWALILGGSPVILQAASLFHRVFERPFQSVRGGSPLAEETHLATQREAKPELSSIS